MSGNELRWYTVLGSGWVWVDVGDDNVDVCLEVTRVRGRLAVTGLYVNAPEVTAKLLRDLQPARLAARSAGRNARVPLDEQQRKELRAQAREAARKRKGPLDEPWLAELREWRHDWTRTPDKPRPALPELPAMLATRDDPSDPHAREHFYSAVAAWYDDKLAEGRSPAVALANEWNVPVNTVRRWVREARIAGALPPARKGAAG